MELAIVGVGRAVTVATAAATIALTAAAIIGEPTRDVTSIARGELQAAVTAEGFVVAQEIVDGRRVLAVDRDGRHHHLAEVFRDGDIRVVGTSAGPAAGYLDGRKFRISRVADEVDLGIWGTNARKLCDGFASNDHRFGIGWLEGDGGVWMVHGPMTGARDVAALTSELDVTNIAAPASWCGIASADDKIGLFWRDRDRLLFQMCTRKKCGGLAGSVKFPRGNVVLGIGCQRNGCLVAHRDQSGKSSLTYVTESGSAKWRAPLHTDATSVSIVAAGDRAFAVGFSNHDGTHVMRYERTGGAPTQRWRGSVGSGVPQLAWSKGYLLIAHYTNDAVTPISLQFPR